MSDELNSKLVELLEDERSVHGGRFFEAGYYMALDYIIESDIEYIYKYGVPLWNKEGCLLDMLAKRKEQLKERHKMIMKRNGSSVVKDISPITGAYETNRPHKVVIAADLGSESFVFGQIAGVEKAMEIVKEFVKLGGK